MDDLKIKEYASIYKKTQKRLSLFLTVLILVVGVVVLSFGIIFLISDSLSSIIIGIIMIIISILDIIMALKFYLTVKKRINNMTDIEAKNRYVKITGKN